SGAGACAVTVMSRAKSEKAVATLIRRLINASPLGTSRESLPRPNDIARLSKGQQLVLLGRSKAREWSENRGIGNLDRRGVRLPNSLNGNVPPSSLCFLEEVISICEDPSLMTEWFARPVLHVTDVDASLDFYINRLGFTCPW